MNRHIIRFTIPLVIAALSLTACNDWVKPEPLGVEVVSPKDVDPEAYQQYQERVRAYKKSDHKLVYVSWENSSEQPSLASDLVSYLPDSVDVVEVVNPELRHWLLADMKKTQEQFGTRFVVRISYDDIVVDWTEEQGEKSQYIAGKVQSLLNIVKNYGYDGITVQYDGLLQTHLKDDELAALKEKEDSFLPLFVQWKAENPGKSIFFRGVPTRTIDHTLALEADAIIIPTLSAKSAAECDFEARNGSNGDFAGAKMLFEVSSIPTDATDTMTGRYTEGDALPLVVEWAQENNPEAYTFAGLCIYHVEWDCLSPSGYYINTRKAMKHLNPNS